MKRCINTNIQIVVAMQFSTDYLPKNFVYTCFFWLPSSGICKNFSNLVACGTQEGAIVIIGKNKNENNIFLDNSSNNAEFEFISLLSGHSAPITDIRVLNKTNTFISVSKDSKICGWSTSDFTCEFQFDFNLNYGDYFFSICTIKYDNVWLIRYGECITLIDLAIGQIIKKIFYPGIKSFEVIYSNLKKRFGTAICIGSVQTTFYSIDPNYEIMELKTIFNNDKLDSNNIMKVSQLGIVKIAGNNFFIHKPSPKFKILYRGTFADLPPDDYIKSISFDQDHNIFAAGSYNGRYFIVNLKECILNDSNSVSIQYLYPISDKNSHPLYLRSGFAINDKRDIIFSSGTKSIYHINSQNQIEKVEFSECIDKSEEEDYESDISYVKDTQSTFYLKSHDCTLSFISFSTQQSFRTIHFHKKITALFERQIGHSEIAVGFEGGEICLYSKHAQFINILAGTVQCFTSPPGKRELLAIGIDGSACIIFPNGTFIPLVTPHVPIICVHYVNNLELYALGLSDGSYLTYSSKSSSPVELSMKLPLKKSSLIWPELTKETVFTEDQISTSFCAQFGRKTVIYRIHDISRLCRFVRENYFQYQKGKKVERSMNSKMKDSIHLINEIFELFENNPPIKTTPKLALLGSNFLPTFFYPSFIFNGQMISELSPSIGSLKFVAYHLLAESTSVEGSLSNDVHFFSRIHFLPTLTQFIYFADEDVQRIACSWCITFGSHVSFQRCQEYMIPFTIYDSIYEVEDYDKFLMALMIIRYPNTLPSSFIGQLYGFLVHQTKEVSEKAVLALSILIEGISLWQGKAKKKEFVYVAVIESMLRQKRSFFLCNKFYNIACADMSAFFAAFSILISTFSNDLQFIQNVLNLYSNVAFKNPKLCGGLTSDMFESQCAKFPQLTAPISNAIETHSKIFQFVKVKNDLVLIGLPDSMIHVYQAGKLLFTEKLFVENADISFVDIGPDNKFGVAASEILKKAKIFPLFQTGKGIFKIKKTNMNLAKEIEINGVTHNCTFVAKWTDPQNCIITVSNI